MLKSGRKNRNDPRCLLGGFVLLEQQVSPVSLSILITNTRGRTELKIVVFRFWGRLFFLSPCNSSQTFWVWKSLLFYYSQGAQRVDSAFQATFVISIWKRADLFLFLYSWMQNRIRQSNVNRVEPESSSTPPPPPSTPMLQNRVLATPGGAAHHSRFLPGTKKKKTISARHYFFFFFFFLVPFFAKDTHHTAREHNYFLEKIFGTCTLRPFWSHSHKSANIGLTVLPLKLYLDAPGTKLVLARTLLQNMRFFFFHD